jgi:hypothetical protein
MLQERVLDFALDALDPLLLSFPAFLQCREVVAEVFLMQVQALLFSPSIFTEGLRLIT